MTQSFKSVLHLSATDDEDQTQVAVPYVCEPLPTVSSFRVLELLQGHEDEEVSYLLHFADWNSPPPYEAISYAWGDTKIKAATICHGKSLNVTPILRDGLRQMRYKDRSRYLWVDGVCIGQKNMQERGYQVEHMGQIYRNATKVLVWLGCDEDNQGRASRGSFS